MTIEIECRLAMSAELQRLRERLVFELQRVIGGTYPENTYLLWFEYESPNFADTFPVMFCRMNRRGHAEEVRKLLPEVSFTISPEIIDDPGYREADLDTWAIAADVFVPWFADCWQEAGGHDSRWAGFLAHHDSIYSFDLTARREVCCPEPKFPDN